MPRIPVWLHGLLCILLPLPCAVALTALYIRLCVAALSEVRFQGWGWVVFGSVLLGIGVFVLGWHSPKRFLRLIGVQCTACGKTARFISKESILAEYYCDTCSMQFASHWDPAGLIAGLICMGMGVTFMVLAVTATVEKSFVVFLIGFAIFGLGTGLIGGKSLRDWMVSQMPWMNRVPWKMILGGGIATAIGVFFICLGFFSPDDSNMPSGRGPVVGAGAAFALAGLCILLPVIGSVLTSIPRRVIQIIGNSLAILLLLSFAAVPALIAFHDAGTPAAHPAPYISTSIIVLLLGICAYVYIRDRRKRNHPQPGPNTGNSQPRGMD